MKFAENVKHQKFMNNFSVILTSIQTGSSTASCVISKPIFHSEKKMYEKIIEIILIKCYELIMNSLCDAMPLSILQ